jgi:hypothetical protein
MASAPQQQELPFLVEPVSQERVQFWASYAGQATTKDGFYTASSAFDAFWYEAAAQYEYQHMMHCFHVGYWDAMVSWLDAIVSSQNCIAARWNRVIGLLTDEGKQQPSAAVLPWYQGAVAALQRASVYQQAAARLVVDWCQQYQISLSEYTQIFFAKGQG